MYILVTYVYFNERMSLNFTVLKDALKFELRQSGLYLETCVCVNCNTCIYYSIHSSSIEDESSSIKSIIRKYKYANKIRGLDKLLICILSCPFVYTPQKHFFICQKKRK